MRDLVDEVLQLAAERNWSDDFLLRLVLETVDRGGGSEEVRLALQGAADFEDENSDP